MIAIGANSHPTLMERAYLETNGLRRMEESNSKGQEGEGAVALDAVVVVQQM